MIEFWKIFSTAVITAGAANVFGYFRDRKNVSTEYSERVLKELYVPIYKVLTGRIIPGDGYDGIDEKQLVAIKEIIEENPELTDPKLDRLIYVYIEHSYFNWKSSNRNDDYYIYDSDRKLLEYILISFNKTRRSIGLPSDLNYAYPILVKFRNWRKKYNLSSLKKNLRRVTKK